MLTTPLFTNRHTFSSAEACALAGITYRQLDYWCRVGPAQTAAGARGSGSRRRFSRQHVLVLAVLAHVAGYVRISQLDELAATLLDWDDATWDTTTLLVTRDGVWLAGHDGAPPVAVAINLAAIRAEVTQRAERLGA